MEFLEWNDETMGVGIKLIDNQHKELLKIINQLSTSIYKNSQRKELVIIIDELIEYAKYHFSTEESLFDIYNYNEKLVHKKEHTLFVIKFIDIKDKILNSELYLMRNAVEIAEDVFTYIIKWFLNHVAGKDRKYIELFRENGIE